MKRFLLFLLITFQMWMLGAVAQAQVPQGIPYQAAARNASGQPLVNTAVKVRFSIIDSVATGTTVYQETHSVTTNNVGLFNVNVGLGTPITGTFSAINWGKNFKFMKVELDPSGAGSNYVDMGTQQMMSVPYALYAGTSQNSSNASCSGKQVFNYTGNVQYFNVPPCAKELIIECWGAQGNGPVGNGGKGGYCSARYFPDTVKTLVIYVGGMDGYNGGGVGVNSLHGITYGFNMNGGGGTDVRINNTLNGRIIVAGGGGACFGYWSYNPNNQNTSLQGGSGGVCQIDFCTYGGDGGKYLSYANTLPGSSGCNSGSSSTNLIAQGTVADAFGGGGGLVGGEDACVPSCNGQRASLGQGSGGYTGGGGGYFGGGSASANASATGVTAEMNAAGGGSSWTGGCDLPYVFIGGINTGNGRVRITWH